MRVGLGVGLGLRVRVRVRVGVRVGVRISIQSMYSGVGIRVRAQGEGEGWGKRFLGRWQHPLACSGWHALGPLVHIHGRHRVSVGDGGDRDIHGRHRGGGSAFGFGVWFGVRVVTVTPTEEKQADRALDNGS